MALIEQRYVGLSLCSKCSRCTFSRCEKHQLFRSLILDDKKEARCTKCFDPTIEEKPTLCVSCQRKGQDTVVRVSRESLDSVLRAFNRLPERFIPSAAIVCHNCQAWTIPVGPDGRVPFCYAAPVEHHIRLQPLGMQDGTIKDSQLTASSIADEDHDVRGARLNRYDIQPCSAWSAAQNNLSQWIKVTFERPTAVIAIATQGRSETSQWVTRYRWEVLTTDGKWKDLGEYDGNNDRQSVVIHKLNEAMLCKEVKICPLAWYRNISLRFELYTVASDDYEEVLTEIERYQPLGMESGLIRDWQITASTSKDEEHSTKGARLRRFGIQAANAWSAAVEDEEPWIKLQFLAPTPIYALAIQGRLDEDQWITRFRLDYLGEDGQWVQENEYDGCYNQDVPTFHKLKTPIVTKELKICVLSWHTHCSLRFEVYSAEKRSFASEGLFPVGLESKLIEDSQLSCTDTSLNRNNARLNANGAWTAPSANDFIQVDFKRDRLIGAIATQGHGTSVVTGFTVEVSNDGKDFTAIKEISENRRSSAHSHALTRSVGTKNGSESYQCGSCNGDFDGLCWSCDKCKFDLCSKCMEQTYENLKQDVFVAKRFFTSDNPTTTSYIRFPYLVSARYVRICPVNWKESISLRMELYATDWHPLSSPFLLLEHSFNTKASDFSSFEEKYAKVFAVSDVQSDSSNSSEVLFTNDNVLTVQKTCLLSLTPSTFKFNQNDKKHQNSILSFFFKIGAIEKKANNTDWYVGLKIGEKEVLFAPGSNRVLIDGKPSKLNFTPTLGVLHNVKVSIDFDGVVTVLITETLDSKSSNFPKVWTRTWTDFKLIQQDEVKDNVAALPLLLGQHISLRIITANNDISALFGDIIVAQGNVHSPRSLYDEKLLSQAPRNAHLLSSCMNNGNGKFVPSCGTYDRVNLQLFLRNFTQIPTEIKSKEVLFFITASKGKPILLQKLLTDTTISINALDELGETALIRATRHGNEDNVKLLLTAPKIKVDHVSPTGSFALGVAATEGHTGILQLLLDALFKGREGKMQEINGVEVNPLLDTAVPLNSPSLFSLALTNGRTEAACLLLEKKANLLKTDKQGNNPLFEAAKFGNVKVLEKVLGSAPPLEEIINAAEKEAKEAKAAKAEGKDEKSGSLVKQNSFRFDKLDPKIQSLLEMTNNNGSTLLHEAIHSNTDTVTYLIRKGIAVDVKDRLGRTPLINAAIAKSEPNIIRALLDCKARADIKDTFRVAAIDYATTTETKGLLARLKPGVFRYWRIVGIQQEENQGVGCSEIQFNVKGKRRQLDGYPIKCLSGVPPPKFASLTDGKLGEKVEELVIFPKKLDISFDMGDLVSVNGIYWGCTVQKRSEPYRPKHVVVLASNIDDPVDSLVPKPLIFGHNQLSASSNPNGVLGALLNTTGYQPINAWTAETNDNRQWISVNLLDEVEVRSVVTQGSADKAHWVTSYILEYSLDHKKWSKINDGQPIEANIDNFSEKAYTLPKPIRARHIRLLPQGWHGQIALRWQVYGIRQISPLGLESEYITDDQLSASTSTLAGTTRGARLNRTGIQRDCHAWSAAAGDTVPWICVDLGKVLEVKAVAVQGRDSVAQWVTSYYLSFSNDGKNFRDYKNKVEIPGCEGEKHIAIHRLRNFVEARFVRIHPVTWHAYISLRCEIYGDPTVAPPELPAEFGPPVGIGSGAIPNSALTASSERNPDHSPRGARLNRTGIQSCNAWAAAVNDRNQWICVDLQKEKAIASIATQGRPEFGQWVTAYTVSYSNDGKEWMFIGDDGDPASFGGNKDGVAVVRNSLPTIIRARYWRLHPQTWNNHIALRFELYEPIPSEQKWSFVAEFKNIDWNDSRIQVSDDDVPQDFFKLFSYEVLDPALKKTRDFHESYIWAASIGRLDNVAEDIEIKEEDLKEANGGENLEADEEEEKRKKLSFQVPKMYLHLGVKDYLERKTGAANINYRDHLDRETALIKAARNNHRQMVEYLISKRASVDAPNKNGESALMVAAAEGHLELCEYLIRSGADKNHRNTSNQSVLVVAIAKKQEAVAWFLLQEGVDITQIDRRGNTLLFDVVKMGSAKVLEFLLQSTKIPVNHVNKKGLSVLHVAVSQKKSELVQLLLKFEANVEMEGKEGRTPFIYAVLAEDVESASALVMKGCAFNHEDRAGYTGLMHAVLMRKPDLVRQLLSLLRSKGADVNHRNKREGITALMLAASQGIIDLIAYLLDSEFADPNIRDHQGRTAIMHAAEASKLGVVDYWIGRETNNELTVADELKDASPTGPGGSRESRLVAPRETTIFPAPGEKKTLMGAIKEDGDHVGDSSQSAKKLTDKPGLVAYLHAAATNNREVVQHLLELDMIEQAKNDAKGGGRSDLDLKDQTNSFGETALMLAAAKNNQAVVSYLLRPEIDVTVDAVDKLGETALLKASKNNAVAAVKMLITAGASIAKTDNRGICCLSWAAQKGHLDVLTVLIDSGADIEQQDPHHLTPLAYACKLHHLSLAAHLLKLGAVTDVQDQTQTTALVRAAKARHWSIVDLLLDSHADPSIRPEDNTSLLMLLAIHGRSTLLDKLIGLYRAPPSQLAIAEARGRWKDKDLGTFLSNEAKFCFKAVALNALPEPIVEVRENPVGERIKELFIPTVDEKKEEQPEKPMVRFDSKYIAPAEVELQEVEKKDDDDGTMGIMNSEVLSNEMSLDPWSALLLAINMNSPLQKYFIDSLVPIIESAAYQREESYATLKYLIEDTNEAAAVFLMQRGSSREAVHKCLKYAHNFEKLALKVGSRYDEYMHTAELFTQMAIHLFNRIDSDYVAMWVLEQNVLRDALDWNNIAFVANPRVVEIANFWWWDSAFNSQVIDSDGNGALDATARYLPMEAKRKPNFFQFYRIPKVQYITQSICLLLYLILFSALMSRSPAINSPITGIEVVCWLFGGSYFLGEASQLRNFKQYVSDGWNSLDLLITIGIIGCIIMRSIGYHASVSDQDLYNLDTTYSAFMMAVQLCLTTRCFSILSLSESFGPLIVSLKKILRQVFIFFGLEFIFIYGFFFVFQFLVAENMIDGFQNSSEMVLTLVFGSLGEGLDRGTLNDGIDQSRIPIADVAVCLFLILGLVILLNLLIAMMSESYADVQGQARQVAIFGFVKHVFDASGSNDLPAPLNVLSFAFEGIAIAFKCCKSRRKKDECDKLQRCDHCLEVFCLHPQQSHLPQKPKVIRHEGIQVCPECHRSWDPEARQPTDQTVEQWSLSVFALVLPIVLFVLAIERFFIRISSNDDDKQEKIGQADDGLTELHERLQKLEEQNSTKKEE